MTTDDRVKSMEQELGQIKEELAQILLDIRAFVMEQQNPLRRYEKPATAEETSGKGAPDNGRKEA